MTDRVLTEEEMFCLETENEEFPPSCFKIRRLIASHRLLQKRVTELEGQLRTTLRITRVLQTEAQKRDWPKVGGVHEEDND